ncbi:hypothetical protein VNO80_04759 [Phaseolus coccineus]|uniref:Uncharacterized protein n=1 Tax=Phaseolus coccineus TaxID=3886 RepID=A0AAN9NUS7_PHACN
MTRCWRGDYFDSMDCSNRVEEEKGPPHSHRFENFGFFEAHLFFEVENLSYKFAHCYFNSLPSFPLSHINNVKVYFSKVFEMLVDCEPPAFIFFHLVLQTIIATFS